MNKRAIAFFAIAVGCMLMSFFFLGVACTVDESADICSGSGASQTQTNNQIENFFEVPVPTMVQINTGMVM